MGLGCISLFYYSCKYGLGARGSCTDSNLYRFYLATTYYPVRFGLFMGMAWLKCAESAGSAIISELWAIKPV